MEATADPFDMVPRLGDHTCRFQQDAKFAEVGIDLDGEAWLDAKPLGAETVQALDAAFGVAAVAAHVPFAGGACGAGHRIGPPHDTDNPVADREAAAARRLDHLAEGFVAEHQTFATRRRFT